MKQRPFRPAVRLAVLPLLPGCVSGGDLVVFEDGDVASCDAADPAFVAGWASALTIDGCRWYLQGVDDDATVLLSFDVPEFAGALAGEAASVTYTLPDDAVRLQVELGCGFDTCGDDDGLSPTVSDTYTPTSGTVDVSVTPDGDAADATVVFTGVGLAGEVGEPDTLDATYQVRLHAGE